jgi:hypothetical protein
VGSITTVLRLIASAEPPRPSSRNSAIGVDSPLERICLKMMAKLPADRFASMAAVAEVLDEVLSPARPTATASAARPSLWKRLFSWAGRPSASQLGALSPDGVPVEGSSEKTVRLSNRSPPAEQKHRQITDQTTDLPQSSSSGA